MNQQKSRETFENNFRYCEFVVASFYIGLWPIYFMLCSSFYHPAFGTLARLIHASSDIKSTSTQNSIVSHDALGCDGACFQIFHWGSRSQWRLLSVTHCLRQYVLLPQRLHRCHKCQSLSVICSPSLSCEVSTHHIHLVSTRHPYSC